LIFVTFKKNNLLLKVKFSVIFILSILTTWSIDSSHAVNFSHNIVLIKNNNNIIPLKRLDTLRIATLNLSNNSSNYFESTIDNYTKSTHYHFNTFSSKKVMKVMKNELEKFNTILISTDTIHESMAYFIESLQQKKKI
jgi:hypothetical protein